MRVFDVGESPTAFIAIGVMPNGVIAIGPLATGVLAIGQLARGVFVIGQLALGVVCFGQLAVGVGWAGGQLAIGGVAGPSMIGVGALGKLGLRDLLHLRWRQFQRYSLAGWRRWAAPLIIVSATILVWFVALQPLIDELGSVPAEQPAQLR
jgi:hypothetical protein